MSTKTLRKRIALVAVSAVSFGLLSTVAAHATDTGANGELVVAANGASATSSRGILSTNGTAGTSALSASTSLTNYGTILAGGSVYATGKNGGATSAISVSGATISSCSAAGGNTTLNTAATNCTNDGIWNTNATVVPNAGVTSFSITSYSTSTMATAVGKIVYTIVPASSVNVLDVGSSYFSTETSAQAASDNVDATWTPTGGTTPSAAATERNDGVAGYVGYYVKDSNGSALVSPTITATSTGGCLLNTADAAGTVSTAYSSTPNSYFRVDQPTAHAPATCTVTITVNGTVAAARTFNFRGQVASIAVTSVAVVKAQAGATANAIYAVAKDAAGNALTNIALAPDTSYYNANLTTVGTVTTAPWGTAATDGSASITCVGSSSNKFRFKTTNASAVVISSPETTINCSGDPANYTATLDKPSYVPGDIAVLTITAKDSKSALTNDAATVGANVAIAGSNLTAVTTPAGTDAFTSGVKKYKFIVGSTEGNYQLSVDLPAWDSSTYSQSAVTVP